MSGVDYLTWAFIALAWVGVAITALFSAATAWHTKTARLYRTDPDRARARNHPRPWWIRLVDKAL